MLNFILSKFRIADLAIDMTSTNTVIFQLGVGVKVNEPSLIVIDENEACLSVGTEADAIRGKTPRGVRVVGPIKNGVIADPECCEKMLQYFLRDVYARKNIIKLHPNILAAVPHHATAAERKNHEETLDATGAKSVSIISTILAASYGTGLKVESCSASMVCNISQNFTEVGLVSMNKVHAAARVNVGYEDFIKAVSQFVKNETEYSIGEKAAERAVKNLATAVYMEDRDSTETILVPGMIKRTSSPVEVCLNKFHIHNTITPCVESILNGIQDVLENAKDDMASDLIFNGITIVGRGSHIARIDEAIQLHTGIKTRIAQSPDTCIAEGTALIMEMMKNKK